MRGGCAQEFVVITLPKLKGPGTKPIAPPHGCDPKSSGLKNPLEVGNWRAAAVNVARGDDTSGARACAAHGRDFKASKAFMLFVRPNVRAKRLDAVDGRACVVQHNRAHHAGPDGRRSGSA